MWYLFSTAEDVVKRKMKYLGMSSFAMIDRKLESGTISGDFSEFTLRVGPGLKLAQIERLINPQTGKITYCISDDKKDVLPLENGILGFLKEKASDRFPIQSELWSTMHHEQAKTIAGRMLESSEKAIAVGAGSTKSDRAGEELKHFQVVWEGYKVGKDKEADKKTDWSSWSAYRDELRKTKYVKWEKLSKATDTSASEGSTAASGDTKVKHYVKFHILMMNDQTPVSKDDFN